MRGETITVAIAESYTLHREGLRCILLQHGDITVAGEAADGVGAVELVRRTSPDILLLEIPLPRRDGLETTKDIVSLETGTKIVALSSLTAQAHAVRVLRAGARGFVPKSARGDELIDAIRRVHKGQTYIPSELQRTFAEKYFRADVEKEAEERLTDREFQVMCLLAAGHTNKEIGNRLYISVKTVDTHRINILRKLHLRNNADIARFAVKKQLIPL